MSSNASTSRRPGVVFGWLSAWTLALYLFAVAVLLGLILHTDHGHFTYALDDPYIHLAMAEQLRHGHYGINPQEASSPASSLLWPFLLAPFADARWAVYLPLLWNVLCGAACCWLFGFALNRWARESAAGHGSFGGPAGRVKLLLSAALLVLVGNLLTLTFVGMEHGLQILLAVVCAYGVTEALSGREIPGICLAAAVLAPAVRYEGVGVTASVAVALCGQRHWRAAATVCVLAVLPLLLFGLFLHMHGLPWVPMSVLVKSRTPAVMSNVLLRYLRVFAGNVHFGLTHPEFWPAAFLGVFFLHQAWKAKDRQRRYALAGTALVALLQSVVGRNGWFTRYEVYAVIFCAFVLVRLLADMLPVPFGFVAGLLFFCAGFYVLSTQSIVAAASDVYRQQFQMSRFTHDFYKGNVAVNDLGMVSFRRPAGTYVLDLWGLASPEAARQRHKDAAWLENIVRAHDVHLVMLYPNWFESIPAQWVPLGSLCSDDRPQALGSNCVVFYDPDGSPAPAMLDAIRRFAAGLPAGVHFSEGKVMVSTEGGVFGG